MLSIESLNSRLLRFPMADDGILRRKKNYAVITDENLTQVKENIILLTFVLDEADSPGPADIAC